MARATSSARSGAVSLSPPTHGRILAAAVPIIAANAAGPTLGLVDTAVLGHLGQVSDLGAIALGSLVFSFVYWTFGFLRMGTTGFVAQALGSGDTEQVRASLLRALAVGVPLGLLLLVLHQPVQWLALRLLDGSPAVEASAGQYIGARIWGAPAALGTFGLMGTLIGLGLGRSLLVLQLLTNALNILLDLLFAGVLGWGAAGVAAGTAIAEWFSFGVGVWLVARALRELGVPLGLGLPYAGVLDSPRLWEALRVNRDILLRTLCLVAGFAGFTQQSARFGDAQLAANHVLLQFVSFSAFFLDGYANVAESFVGAAAGARHSLVFDAAVRRSTHLALATALGLALGILLLGGPLVGALTDLPVVEELARKDRGYAAVYVLVAVWAFQLDGIFIAVTRARDMRNSAALSLLVFAGLGWLLVGRLGNPGLWLAMIGYAAARGVSLGFLYPGLRRAAVG